MKERLKALFMSGRRGPALLALIFFIIVFSIVFLLTRFFMGGVDEVVDSDFVTNEQEQQVFDFMRTRGSGNATVTPEQEKAIFELLEARN